MTDDFIHQVGRGWEPLWQPPARWQEVIDARQQLHWAVTLLAAVAAAEIEPADGDGHLAMGWDARRRRFVGQRTRSGQRLSLDPAALELSVDGEATLDLAGRTLDAALSWLAGRVRAAAGGEPRLTLAGDGLPDHPVAAGTPFSPAGPAHAELARWYADAAHLLAVVRGHHRGVSPARCWPHHFDVAAQIPYGSAPGGEARSIGVGMTPGDGWHPEPYFYVLPWPPPSERPQRLGSGGFWNTEGWVGAALVAHRMSDRPPERQGAQVAAFVQSAVTAAKALIGVA